MWNRKQAAHILGVFSESVVVFLFFPANQFDIDVSKAFGETVLPVQQNPHVGGVVGREVVGMRGENKKAAG